MKTLFILLTVLLTACASGMAPGGDPAQPDGGPAARRLLYQYESSGQCRGCHADQYFQYQESMHAKAFSNPLFNSQYFNDIVPRAQRDPNFLQEARRCIACHAPTVFMNYTGLVTTPAQANLFETGVTCDFCHTLAGYAANGDYLQDPSGKKQGPFEERGSVSHHSEFSGFVQLGEFCGRCHNATNHAGLEVKSTYYEWRESDYGKRGFACQECHMNKDGFLRDGAAGFERGQAAYINVGSSAKQQQEHEKLYNHSFPGAHSISQLQDALLLEFKVGTRTAYAGGILPFTLVVSNERTGHKMPSGSSDLRFMWLEVTATAENGAKIPVSLRNAAAGKPDSYAIAGLSADDAAILVNDVPKGSRLYRTVLVNAAGRQSLFQYDAVANVFDNRLNAGEVRKEGYFLQLPARYSGKVTIDARLYYRNAPSSFAKRMQVPDSSPVLVAHQNKKISIVAPNAPE